MPDFFPLQIFPEGSLASSVITTVWVGVFVIALLNLRFGWALTGLVVPGYLVPLLLLKPWSVLAIFTEGIVTYAIVWFFSDYLSRLGRWSSLFGRDRFFALVLVSILVRVFFDGWLFQYIGEYLVRYFHISFDYRDNLHSFGLIIVILIANHFWKPRFEKGLITLIVPLAATYLIVRYGLLELTNFRISDLGYLYEELASSVLAGPKSYIILITAAYVASRMNLRYGWDFSGILIPALIAMQWFQPIKIVASIGEAFVILLLARLLLASPLFRTASVEGARKVLLFFNIGFAYKMVLAYLFLAWAPDVKITDYFGFGYLLSTLIAIKMYDKDIAMRMTRAVLQTSLVAVIAASLIGVLLTMIPTPWTWQVPGVAAGNAHPVRMDSKQTLSERVRQDSIRLYRHWASGTFEAPLPLQVDIFSAALKSLQQYVGQRDPKLLDQAGEALAQLGYGITLIENRYLYLSEDDFSHGWGVYIIDLDHPHGLLVEVPAPVSEKGALNAGLITFMSMHGKALAIAGAPRKVNVDRSADAMRNLNLLFHAFHKTFAMRNVLQIHGYTLQSARALSGVRRQLQDIDLPLVPSKLWVKGALPPSLDIGLLKYMLGDYEISWEKTPFKNIQRDYTRAGFAELYINDKDVRRLMARYLLTRTDIQAESGEQRIDGYLQDWLLSGKIHIAPRGSNAYVPPTEEYLLFIDREILVPLLHIGASEFREGQWTEAGLQELRAVAVSASVLNYQLIRYTEKLSGRQYLILAEKPDAVDRRYWGTYVFSLNGGSDTIVQVPRPLYEVSSFEYGVSLFERLNARALLIGGAHHEANRDRSSDLIRQDNISNVFNLVNQVLMREAGEKPMLAVQCRGFGAKPNVARLPDADVLVGFSGGVMDEGSLSALERRLYQSMLSDGLKVRIVDGSLDTIGYEVGALPQSLYLAETANKEFSVLWLSSLTRFSYRQQTDNYVQAAQFRALDLANVNAELHEFVNGRPWAEQISVPDTLRQQILRYITTQDIVALQQLVTGWPQFHFARLVDINTRQAFLSVSSDDRLILLANLVPRDSERVYRAIRGQDNATLFSRYITTRAAWLMFGEH